MVSARVRAWVFVQAGHNNALGAVSVAVWLWCWWYSGDGSDGDDCNGDCNGNVIRWWGVMATKWG